MTKSKVPIDPQTEASFLNEVGYESMIKGDFASALKSLQRAAELDPANNDVSYNITACKHELGMG